jgi:hypothetical protein
MFAMSRQVVCIDPSIAPSLAISRRSRQHYVGEMHA